MDVCCDGASVAVITVVYHHVNLSISLKTGFFKLPRRYTPSHASFVMSSKDNNSSLFKKKTIHLQMRYVQYEK